jgi:hypothetical protein
MPQKNRTFTPTKLNISEVQDEEVRGKLETKFYDYQFQKQLSVETSRKALIAQLEAKIQEANAQKSLTQFLLETADEFEQIKTEPIWFAYKQNGEIVLENPFSERDMRNSIRLQRSQLEHQQKGLAEDNGSDKDLYETDED